VIDRRSDILIDKILFFNISLYSNTDR